MQEMRFVLQYILCNQRPVDNILQLLVISIANGDIITNIVLVYLAPSKNQQYQLVETPSYHRFHKSALAFQ